MTGEIEAAADLVTGAVWGRAAGGNADVTSGHEGGAAHAPMLCLNCGTRLIGAHCHACGQNGHVHRTVGAIGHEIAHGVFHFEGKVWRTLPMLAWRPGELTRRYIDGERARFVSPLALFLFSVFLLFAAISWVGGDMAEQVSPHAMASRQAGFATAIARAQTQLTKREATRAALVRTGRPTDEVDTDITALNATIAALQTTQTAAAGQHATTLSTHIGRTGWDRLDHGIAKARDNPGLMLYKMQSSAYKYSWLLIPLSTPFVAMLFLWRRRFGLYDHAVFVTFSIAFMMMLVTVVTLAGAAGVPDGVIVPAMLVIPPLHMYRQLRGTYGLGRFAAHWRTVVLTAFAFTVLAAFIILLLVHGLTE